MNSLIIAVDGPAASGKGTLARRLAHHMGLRHLDTGLTYRALASAILQAGISLDDESLVLQHAQLIRLDALDHTVLSLDSIGEFASRVAMIASVRNELVVKQQAFAYQYPGSVLDGRDIGTVVCPDAPVKLFVTASATVRAKRRYDEMIMRGESSNYDEILTNIFTRDQRDSNRANSPLRPAEDAHLIDTSEMDIETAFRTALAIVEKTVARLKLAETDKILPKPS